MQSKIGVFGSSSGDIDSIRSKAHAIGEALGKAKAIVISGACDGLPYEASVAAKEQGATLWGYSQGADFSMQQERVPDIDSNIFDKLFYIPQDYEFKDNTKACQKYRNVTSTATSDGGIIISGRWGTMNEFTNLHDMGKVIGVLTGTEGIADALPELMKKISKKSGAVVIFESDPKKLVQHVMEEIKKRKSFKVEL